LLDVLIPALAGTVIGAVLGFAGAAWLDKRRFDRDTEVRFAEGLRRAATDLSAGATRVAAEGGAIVAVRDHTRGVSETLALLSPSAEALAAMSRALAELERDGSAEVGTAARRLFEHANDLFHAAGSTADADEIRALAGPIPELRRALDEALRPQTAVLRPVRRSRRAR
jgi:hypothetical protein